MKSEELLQTPFMRDPATGNVYAHSLEKGKILVFEANKINVDFYHLLEAAQFMYFTLSKAKIIASIAGMSNLAYMAEIALNCAENGIETTTEDIKLQKELGL